MGGGGVLKPIVIVVLLDLPENNPSLSTIMAVTAIIDFHFYRITSEPTKRIVSKPFMWIPLNV